MAAPPLGDLHVLVVDDNALIRDLVEMVLHGLGVTRVSFAVDGFE